MGKKLRNIYLNLCESQGERNGSCNCEKFCLIFERESLSTTLQSNYNQTFQNIYKYQLVYILLQKVVISVVLDSRVRSFV